MFPVSGRKFKLTSVSSPKMLTKSKFGKYCTIVIVKYQISLDMVNILYPLWIVASLYIPGEILVKFVSQMNQFLSVSQSKFVQFPFKFISTQSSVVGAFGSFAAQLV